MLELTKKLGKSLEMKVPEESHLILWIQQSRYHAQMKTVPLAHGAHSSVLH